jgi:conjugal transfer/type IV secretion protein DotA/TraY
MSMPFSPCSDAATCDDKYVEILSHVFGPVIDKMVVGESLDEANASTNIFAAMVSNFNSGVLTVAAIILTYVTLIGIANTANDGEVLGNKWSSFWTPMRSIFGAGMLLPTSSGYSFVQLFTFMIALWGGGLANKIYDTGIATSVFSPNAIVADVHKTGEFYGLRQFALNYALSKQCVRLINEAYASSTTSKPVIAINPDKPDQSKFIGNGQRQDTYVFKDRNPQSNLGGGSAVCGSFSLISYSGAPSTDSIANSINNIDITITATKKSEVSSLMNAINKWVDTWPTSNINADWSKISSKEFIGIVQKHELNITTSLTNAATSSTGDLKDAINEFQSSLTSQGWSMAGGWFQRVGAARQGLIKSFNREVATAIPPSAESVAITHETQEVSLILNAIQKGLTEKIDATEADMVEKKKPSFSDIEKYFPKNNKPDIGMIQKVMSGINSIITYSMESTVNIFIGSDGTGKTMACGSNGEMGGSINRIKCAGDYIASIDAGLSILKINFQFAIAALTTTLGAIDAVPGVSVLTDTTALVVSVTHISDQILNFLSDILFWLKAMAFYFSVLLPSLPYIAFIIVVVGNVLAVAQTVLVSPLWAMMHTRPDNSFVGQDRQGYLMYMSLFVRPSLSILGLFLACLIADPIINYVAIAFFEMRDALQKGSGAIGVISNFYTYVWWFAAFGLTLLPIMYMIFFLPQTLPDEILRWLGGGLNSLGDSSAIGIVQSGLSGMYGRSTMYGGSPGKLGGNPNGGGKPRINGGGKPRINGGGGGVLANGQGIAPSSSEESTSLSTKAGTWMGEQLGKEINKVVQNSSSRKQAIANAEKSYFQRNQNPPTGDI